MADDTQNPGGDGKYGRIYTEKDVRLIVQTAMENDIESEDELDGILAELDAPDSDLTFFPDEPLFVLRGKDYSSVETIQNYRKITHGNGSPPEQVDSVDRAIQSFAQFAAGNPDRMKVAD